MRTIEHRVPAKDAALIKRFEHQLGDADGTLWDTVITLDDEHCLDITMYESPGDTPWVDAVLFRKGHGNGYVEVGALDVVDSVFGEYELPDLDVRVVVSEAA